MPKFDFPADLDLSKIDWSKFDPTKIDWSNLELPKFELPKFDLPKFELPELPEVDLPSAEQVLGFARDAAYVSVGLAVLTAERVQKLQQELLELLKAQVERVRAAV
jgi:hypothetical protein